MKKFNIYIFKYLLFSFPAVVIVFITSQTRPEVQNITSLFISIIWEILVWHMILWFIILIYALFVLLFSPALRNSLLAKLSRIKERDEREAFIIGRSSRFTFFSTFALLVFFLFFATVNITISKLPVEQRINGKKHQLSIGLAYKFFEDSNKEIQNRNVIFSTQSSLPFTRQNMLILIIIWHIGSFYYSSKKMQIKE
jgi:hypothetical protein